MKTMYSLISIIRDDEITHNIKCKVDSNPDIESRHEPIGERRCELTRETERFSKDVLNKYGAEGITRVTVTFETGELETERIHNPIKRVCNNFYAFAIKYFSGLRCP